MLYACDLQLTGVGMNAGQYKAEPRAGYE